MYDAFSWRQGLRVVNILSFLLCRSKIQPRMLLIMQIDHIHKTKICLRYFLSLITRSSCGFDPGTQPSTTGNALHSSTCSCFHQHIEWAGVIFRITENNSVILQINLRKTRRQHRNTRSPTASGHRVTSGHPQSKMCWQTLGEKKTLGFRLPVLCKSAIQSNTKVRWKVSRRLSF